MEGTVEKDTISPVKDNKISPVKESKTAEVEPCIHNGATDEVKTKTPEKVANGNTPDKKTPDQGIKRKTEEISTETDEIKKVKVAEDDEDLSPKESSESDEPLKPAKKLDDDDVVSESGTVQEAC